MAISSASASQTETSSDHELVITRIFNAPRSLVWQAWTDPERMTQWLGPKGFTGAVEKMEPHVGGSYRFRISSPERGDLWMQGVNREVVPPERLSYTWTWADVHGRPTGPETLVTVTFAEADGGRTRLTLRQAVFDTVVNRDGHREGWSSSFDCLEEYLRATA